MWSLSCYLTFKKWSWLSSCIIESNFFFYLIQKKMHSKLKISFFEKVPFWLYSVLKPLSQKIMRTNLEVRSVIWVLMNNQVIFANSDFETKFRTFLDELEDTILASLIWMDVLCNCAYQCTLNNNNMVSNYSMQSFE